MMIIEKIKAEYELLNKPIYFLLIIYTLLYMIFDIEQKIKGNILAFFIAVFVIFTLLQCSKVSLIKTPYIFTSTVIYIIIIQTLFVTLRMN